MRIQVHSTQCCPLRQCSIGCFQHAVGVWHMRTVVARHCTCSSPRCCDPQDRFGALCCDAAVGIMPWSGGRDLMSCQYIIVTRWLIRDELHLFGRQLFETDGGQGMTTCSSSGPHALVHGPLTAELTASCQHKGSKSMWERVNSPKETAHNDEQSNPTYHHPNDRTSRQS